MPYRKRYYKRRVNYRSKRKGRRMYKNQRLIDGTSHKTLPQKLLDAGAPIVKVVSSLVKGYQGVRGLINSETKFVDTMMTGAYSSFGYTGTNIPLTTISQGVTENTRTGNSVLTKKLYYDMNLQHNVFEPDFTHEQPVVQYAITAYKEDTSQSVGGPPLADYIDTSQGITPGISPLIRNRDHGSDFVTLKRGYYSFPTTRNNFRIKGSIPLNIHTKFDSTASNTWDKNSLWMHFFSNLTGSNKVDVKGRVRTYFMDN